MREKLVMIKSPFQFLLRGAVLFVGLWAFLFAQADTMSLPQQLHGDTTCATYHITGSGESKM